MIDLSSFIQYHARVSPAREAVLFGSEAVTYGELWTRVQSLTGWLAARGVGKKSVVAILLKNSAAFFEFSFALSYLGAIMLPINYRLAQPEIDHILRDAGASLAICDEELEGLLNGWENVFSLDREAQRNTSTFSGSHPLPERAEANLNDLFRLMYTSGTTGHPKGVMHTYSNLYWKNMSLVIGLDLTWRDRIFCSGPLYHVGAFDAPAIVVLWLGGTVYIQREFDAVDLAKAIDCHGLTGGWLAPVMLARLQDVVTLRHDVSSLRFIIGGGGATAEKSIRTFERLFPNARYINGFGLTETCSSDVFMEPGYEIAKIAALGRPLPHVELRIGDENGRALSPGAEGEILLKGPKITQGYWNDPEKTQQSFFGPWFRTGDVGYVDEDGFLYMTDRIKDMIKSGGENIASSEIERVVIAMPEVAEVAVVAQSDEKWGQIAVTFVVLKPDTSQSFSGDDIICHCRNHLAGFKIPRRIIFTESLPRNPSGKILKRELRKMLAGAEGAFNPTSNQSGK